MHGLKARQLALNAETRDAWDAFAGHRARVTRLLAASGDPGKSRLCILGAGNCNDLDLAALLEAHREVHLVDMDAEALARGVSRQGVAEHPSLRTYGEIDVGGMLEEISACSPGGPIGPEILEACSGGPVRRVGPLLPGPFDLVASTCMLTQLIASVAVTVGHGHPRFVDLVQAVRAGHLRLLAHLAAPGGAVILVTDIVSSETFPSLGSVPDHSLTGLLTRLAGDRNFFHGVNPAVLLSVTAADPTLSAALLGPETAPPWRWDLGPRLYRTWALRWRKRA